MFKRIVGSATALALLGVGLVRPATAITPPVTEVGGAFNVPQVSAVSESNHATLGGYLYYIGSDGEHGNELWRTNGTPAGTSMVADVSPGPASTFINGIFSAGGRIYFSDGESVTWVSGGTAVSTRLLVRAGTYAAADAPAITNGALLSMRTNDEGAELWSTNGTPAGTHLLADIKPGAEGSYPSNFERIGDYQYFIATIDTCDCIYRSNGLSVSLIEPQDEQPGASGAKLLNVNGDLVFIGGNYVDGEYLYRWDGSSLHEISRLYVPSDPVLADGVVYVRANRDGGTPHLLRYDTSDDSLTDLNASGGSTWFRDGFVLGKKFIFGQSDGDQRTLWQVTDNTASPSQIATLPSDSGYGEWLRGAVIANNKLFITMRSDEHQYVTYFVPTSGDPVRIPKGKWDPIWPYDGFPAVVLNGKVVVTGQNSESVAFLVAVTPNESLSHVVLSEPAGPRFDDPSNLPGIASLTLNGTFYFTSMDNRHGLELWALPRGATTARMVKDIYVGSGDSNPSLLTAVGGKLIFAATSARGGREVWTTDGTTAGTKQLLDGEPGGGGSGPQELTSVGREGYFTLQGTGELWRTDGTRAGTQRVVVDAESTEFLSASVVGAEPDALLFMGVLESGYSLYKVGPSMEEAHEVFHFTSDYINIEQIVRMGNKYVFSSYGSDGEGLFALAADFHTAPVSLDAFEDWVPPLIGSSNGYLLYTHFDPDKGVQLWRTNGTRAGTRLVKDINPAGESDRVVSGMARIGSVFYLIASKRDSDWQLWRTDGTATGTRELKQIATGGRGALSPQDKFYVADGKLFFAAMDNGGHSKLWQSDGTASGTAVVDSITTRVGMAGVVGNRVLYFGNRGGAHLGMFSVNVG